MKITELQQVQQQVTIGYKCDACSEIINNKDFPENWIRYNHGHSDWGNDSRDSIEYFDVCSIPCLKKQLIESIREVGSYKSGYISIFNLSISVTTELINHLK